MDPALLLEDLQVVHEAAALICHGGLRFTDPARGIMTSDLDLLMQGLQSIHFLPDLALLGLDLLLPHGQLSVCTKLLLLKVSLLVLHLGPGMPQGLLVVPVSLPHTLLQLLQPRVLLLQALTLTGQRGAVVHLAALHVPQELGDAPPLLLHLLGLRGQAHLHLLDVLLPGLELPLAHRPLHALIRIYPLAHALHFGDGALDLFHQFGELVLSGVSAAEAFELQIRLLLHDGERALMLSAQLLHVDCSVRLHLLHVHTCLPPLVSPSTFLLCLEALQQHLLGLVEMPQIAGVDLLDSIKFSLVAPALEFHALTLGITLETRIANALLPALLAVFQLELQLANLCLAVGEL
mmetsp:Transcript_27127/g.48317  ORF Transcript_27127/g.48317 Transcript_27127/m.48317 type:complete len:349 (-) Transcript_27127:199-1245(-)